MTKSTKLVIAENLVRVYRQVLEEPVPPQLLDLVRRLTAQEGRGQ
jgi:hypothetical protein